MHKDDDPESIYHEPNMFVKGFSAVGALVAVGAFAAIITAVVVAISGWFRFKFSIFSFGWAVCSRLFEYSVRRGITNNLDTSELTHERKTILGEQLIMLSVTHWFIRIELCGCAIVFLAELIMG